MMNKYLKAFRTEVFRPSSPQDARESCRHALMFVPAVQAGGSFDDMMRSRAVCMAIYAGALDLGLEKAIGVTDNEWCEAMGKPLNAYLPDIDFSKDPAYAPPVRSQAAAKLKAHDPCITVLAGGPTD